MCGLWGIASTGNLNYKDFDVVESLGRLSTPRGKDSTGVVTINFNKNKKETTKFFYNLCKDVCEPTYFFNRKPWKELRKAVCQVIMGHNRHATVGDVTKSAAHPFEIRNDKGDFKLIGMHNGTLSEYVDKKEEDTYLNDSHKFYTEAGNIGFKETLEKLEEHSAYAFVFITLDCMPTFFRNSGRTLFFALYKNEKTIIWASEKRILESVQKYHDLEFSDEIKPLPTNNLIKLRLDEDKIKSTVKADFIDKKLIEKHEKKKTVRYVYPSYGGGESYLFDGWSYGRHSHKVNHSSREGYSFPSNNSKLSDEDKRASLTFKPAVNTIEWRLRNGLQERTQYITETNVRFGIMFDEWKRREFLNISVPMLSQDENTYDIFVELPRKDGKKKIKRVSTSHDHWYGWNELYDIQASTFNKWCECKILGPLSLAIDKLTYNDMRRRAREISEIWKSENKKNKKETEVVELLQEDDEEKKGPLFYRHHREMPIKEAIEKFNTCFCAVCDQKQSLNDRVFFTPSEDIICFNCEGIDLVRSQYPSDQLVEGRVIRYA